MGTKLLILALFGFVGQSEATAAIGDAFVTDPYTATGSPKAAGAVIGKLPAANFAGHCVTNSDDTMGKYCAIKYGATDFAVTGSYVLATAELKGELDKVKFEGAGADVACVKEDTKVGPSTTSVDTYGRFSLADGATQGAANKAGCSIGYINYPGNKGIAFMTPFAVLVEKSGATGGAVANDADAIGDCKTDEVTDALDCLREGIPDKSLCGWCKAGTQDFSTSETGKAVFCPVKAIGGKPKVYIDGVNAKENIYCSLGKKTADPLYRTANHGGDVTTETSGCGNAQIATAGEICVITNTFKGGVVAGTQKAAAVKCATATGAAEGTAVCVVCGSTASDDDCTKLSADGQRWLKDAGVVGRAYCAVGDYPVQTLGAGFCSAAAHCPGTDGVFNAKCAGWATATPLVCGSNQQAMTSAEKFCIVSDSVAWGGVGAEADAAAVDCTTSDGLAAGAAANTACLCPSEGDKKTVCPGSANFCTKGKTMGMCAAAAQCENQDGSAACASKSCGERTCAATGDFCVLSTTFVDGKAVPIAGAYSITKAATADAAGATIVGDTGAKDLIMGAKVLAAGGGPSNAVFCAGTDDAFKNNKVVCGAGMLCQQGKYSGACVDSVTKIAEDCTEDSKVAAGGCLCKGVVAEAADKTPIAFGNGRPDQYCIGAGMLLKYGAAMSAKACKVDDGVTEGDVVLTKTSAKLTENCACGNVLGTKYTTTTTTASSRRLADAIEHYCHGWASDKKAGKQMMYTVNQHQSCNTGAAEGKAAIDGVTNITVAHCQCGSVVCKGGDASVARGCIVNAHANSTINDTHLGACIDIPTTTTTTTVAAKNATDAAANGTTTKTSAPTADITIPAVPTVDYSAMDATAQAAAIEGLVAAHKLKADAAKQITTAQASEAFKLSFAANKAGTGWTTEGTITASEGTFELTQETVKDCTDSSADKDNKECNCLKSIACEPALGSTLAVTCLFTGAAAGQEGYGGIMLADMIAGLPSCDIKIAAGRRLAGRMLPKAKATAKIMSAEDYKKAVEAKVKGSSSGAWMFGSFVSFVVVMMNI